MLKTRITKLFGIRFPIIVGTMAHLTNSNLVGAISEAGALGVLASFNYNTKTGFRKAIREVRQITNNPFAVNLNMFPSKKKVNNTDYIDVILDEGVPIVETSGHKAPEKEWIDRLKRHDVKVIHKCVGVRYAKKAEALGVDAITVVGFENGGATGMMDITTLCLVPRVVRSVKIPVIGGGGVSDGVGMLAVLSLGAEGVIMGTRFLLCEEIPIHPGIKESLVKASELDTILVLRSINNTHRVYKNKAAQNTAEMEAKGCGLEELLSVITGERSKAMYKSGDMSFGLISCGQGIGLISDIKPVSQIIDDIVNEAKNTFSRLSSLFEYSQMLNGAKFT